MKRKVCLSACFCLVMAFLLLGCKTQKSTVIEKDKLVYVTKDTTIYKDTVVYIPFESVKEIVPLYDTLYLETSIAVSKCYVDTLNKCLKGQITNKKAVEYKSKYQDHVITKDSIIYKEKPIPYKVIEKERHIPFIAWASMAWAAISLLLFGYRLFKKLS